MIAILDDRDLYRYTFSARSEVHSVEKATSLCLSLSHVGDSGILERCRRPRSICIGNASSKWNGRLAAAIRSMPRTRAYKISCEGVQRGFSGSG